MGVLHGARDYLRSGTPQDRAAGMCANIDPSILSPVQSYVPALCPQPSVPSCCSQRCIVECGVQVKFAQPFITHHSPVPQVSGPGPANTWIRLKRSSQLFASRHTCYYKSSLREFRRNSTNINSNQLQHREQQRRRLGQQQQKASITATMTIAIWQHH